MRKAIFTIALALCLSIVPATTISANTIDMSGNNTHNTFDVRGHKQNLEFITERGNHLN